MGSDLSKWQQDHQSIDMLSNRLSRLLDSGASAADLSMTLQHLVELVEEHITTEDAMLYELEQSGRAGTSGQQVRATRKQFEQLKCDWQVYFTAWSSQAIARDRNGFEQTTRMMLRRLRDRIAFEDELLVTMALGRGSPGGSRQPAQ